MQDITERNKCFNELLQGEISAQETYDQVIEKVRNETGASELRRIREDHFMAAETLREEITAQGGNPEQKSGAWGKFAKAVTGAARVFGDKTALKALKEGEEHGIKNYEDAIKNDALSESDRELIRSRLLPMQRTHIDTLNQFMDAS